MNPGRRQLLRLGLAAPLWAMAGGRALAATALGAFRAEVVDLDFTDRAHGRVVRTRCYKPVGAGDEPPPWRLTAFHKSPPGQKYAAVLKGFRHMDFDPSSTDPEHGAQGEAFRALQLSFWKATLLGDRSGYAQLEQTARRSKVTDPVWLRSR